MAGKATGERIEPRRRRKVIEGAVNGMSINKISKYANLTRPTAKAIVDQNQSTIAQRKERLTDLYASIAQRGAERLLDGIDTAPYGSLIPITGMSTDKLLALTQDPQSQVNNNLHLHLDGIDVLAKFNQMLKQLPVQSNQTSEHPLEDAVLNSAREASTQEKQIEAKEIEPKQDLSK